MPKRLLDSDEGDNNNDGHQDEMSVPFPLADLPYDLLEETAAYFTQHEAVKILTVSKNFNMAFTRSVWRCLKSRGKAVRLPAAMWEKYGHLVRTADLACSEEVKDIAVRMPNVKHLTLHFGYSMRYFLSMELPRLCSLRLHFTGWRDLNKEPAIKLIEWIQDIEKRGQRLDVHWDLKCSYLRHYPILNCILEAFGDSTGHTLTLRVSIDEPEPIARYPQLFQKLTKLEIKHAYDSLFFFQQCAALFDDDDITYPRLHTLVLSQKYNEDGDDEYKFDNFTPDRFPLLRRLELVFHQDDGFVTMKPMFEHDWPTVTELSVLYCDDDDDRLERILCRFPNVTKLSMSEVFCGLSLHMVAKHMPRLESLTLDDITEMVVVDSRDDNDDDDDDDDDERESESPPQSPKSWPTLSNLKELSAGNPRSSRCGNITVEVLLFILHSAPNLCSLELTGCYFDIVELDRCTGQTLESMRKLAISYGEYGFGDTQLAKFLTFLPNLRWLRLIDGDRHERAQIQSRYPHTIVETVKSRDLDDDDDD